MYYNNVPSRYPQNLVVYRGPRVVQVGSGPNFRQFFSSVYSGLRPLFSSAIAALKGSAQEAGKNLLYNFGQKDFPDLLRGAGQTFVDDLRDRAVGKINRMGQTGSGYGNSKFLYKGQRPFNPNLFGVNPSTFAATGALSRFKRKTKSRTKKRKSISKKSITIGRRKRKLGGVRATQRINRRYIKQTGQGKRQKKHKKIKRVGGKKKRNRRLKQRQLDIFG